MLNLYKSKGVSLNRKFGFLFGGVFIFLSAYYGCRGASAITVWSLFISGGTLVLIAMFNPNVLTPFSKFWMNTGELMGRVISPLVLGIIFFLLITPVALLTRFFGRDELKLNKTDTGTYWISRASPGPTGDSFNNQF